MIQMIVLTELFLIFKHGQNQFSHAYISPLGWVFLSILVGFFVLVFLKVLISDLINLAKFKSKIIYPTIVPKINDKLI